MCEMFKDFSQLVQKCNAIEKTLHSQNSRMWYLNHLGISTNSSVTLKSGWPQIVLFLSSQRNWLLKSACHWKMFRQTQSSRPVGHARFNPTWVRLVFTSYHCNTTHPGNQEPYVYYVITSGGGGGSRLNDCALRGSGRVSTKIKSYYMNISAKLNFGKNSSFKGSPK